MVHALAPPSLFCAAMNTSQLAVREKSQAQITFETALQEPQAVLPCCLILSPCLLTSLLIMQQDSTMLTSLEAKYEHVTTCSCTFYLSSHPPHLISFSIYYFLLLLTLGSFSCFQLLSLNVFGSH